jgi:hypothetical protein
MKAAVGVVLDAGVFISLERRNRVLVALVNRFIKTETQLVTSAGVVAQVGRGGSDRQAPLAYLLQHTVVAPLDYAVARTLGRILGASGTADPIDAHVVLLARQRGWPVLTSDPQDLLAIDPTLVVERV